jgi:hypothetical protein
MRQDSEIAINRLNIQNKKLFNDTQSVTEVV